MDGGYVVSIRFLHYTQHPTIMKTEHLLIIRFSAMGDVAMLVPVVANLAKQYPNVRITVLSRPFAKAFFDNIAPNVGFMAADLKGENKGIKGLNKLYQRLQAKHFTAVADMHDVLRTKYLRMRFVLDRKKISHIDKHRNDKKRLCSGNKKYFRQLSTSFENYAEVLKKIGYPITLSPLDYHPSPLTQLPEPFNIKPNGEKWIGIAPFAAHKGKIYPLEKMQEVINIIFDRYNNVRVCTFGAGKEMETLNYWADKYPGCINASKALNGLSQELVLMSNLDVMISMDSANMHLASMMGTPVVSVWGATHPYAGFMGWGQKQENAIQKDMECRPCSVYGNKECVRGDYACLHTISPEEIVKKTENLLF